MFKFLCLIFILLSPLSIFAVDYSSLPGILNNDLMRKQQEQIENQRREILLQREQNQEKIPVSTDVPQLNPSIDPNLCFDIKKIQLNGATMIEPSLQQELLSDFLDSCLGINELNELLHQLTNWYFDKGYVTTRIYFPQQDLSDGTLTIDVVEGSIESIQFNDPLANKNLSLKKAMPTQQGELLNIRDLEQGLEQLNRLSSNNVRLQFVPGDKPGGTRILVDNEQEKFWRINLSYNNSGQKSTGEQQRSLFLDWDSPVKQNGYFYLSYQEDVKNDHSDGKGSDNLSLHYDLANGYWNLFLDASWSSYLTSVDGQQKPLKFKGKSNQQRLALAKIIYRDQQSKWRISSGLIRKDNKNYVENVLIQVNSRTLSIAEFDISYWRYMKNGALFSGTVGYERGLTLFNALNDDKQTKNFPKAQFNKYTLELDYQHPFEFIHQPWRWHSALKGQYSDDLLYGTERLSLGSQYSIRSYKENGLSGDSGVYLRNDLSTNLPAHWFNQVKGNLQLSTGFDIGMVSYQKTDKESWQSLKGWFVGANWYSPHVMMSLTYSKPIAAPTWLQTDSSVTYFNISLNY